MSYDEDVYDYELSDDDGDDTNREDDNFDAKKAYLELKRYAARQRKSKDVSPESDYASEKEIEDKQQDGKDNMKRDKNTAIADDDDNTIVVSTTGSDDEDVGAEKSFGIYEDFNVTLLKTPFAQDDNNEGDNIEYDDIDEDEKDSDDDVNDDNEDFLTTTFTWNLRNKPKLQIIDSNGGDDDDDDVDDVDDDNDCCNLHKQDNEQICDENEDKFDVEQEKSLNKFKEILCQKQNIKAATPEKEQKQDKLERSWPWADREKIIYKQSTCHLVPHKPLGLIEQRIQLLAKRNLLEHISKIKNPQ